MRAVSDYRLERPSVLGGVHSPERPRHERLVSDYRCRLLPPVALRWIAPLLLATPGALVAADLSFGAVLLEVLPFEMAEPGAIRLCCWSSYNEDAVQDLLAHGNNVFTVGLPPATVAENAPEAVSIDTSALDAFVAPLAGHDVFLLMGGIPSLGVPMESDDYGRRLSRYLDLLMTHLATKNVDT